ncbi:hypothetical protein EVJ58_g7617 [Rhodofomes roseus]|uniref:LIM zinc-binding domain-containing protein n=1 Tax=Rhodofomes roseus TaxID=34475 RepID=A0A4Y9Y3H4_9APHY|nr:hypothetical protein EVJ58_g7617 [Rhodofomes roseus]
MAQNVYTYPQPGMAAQYDPRTQPYPYQAYPRQQQQQPPQQQVYNQANAAPAYPYAPSTYQAHVHAGMAAPVTRSPLPAPPQPIAYGHPPQPQYTARPAYSPQSTYAPSSFDQRATLPQRTTPSPGPTRRPLPDPGHTARSNSVSAHPSPQPPPSPGPRAPSHRSALSVSSIPTPPARPTSPRVPQPKTTTAVSPPRPLPQPALPRSIGQSNLARSPTPDEARVRRGADCPSSARCPGFSIDACTRAEARYCRIRASTRHSAWSEVRTTLEACAAHARPAGAGREAKHRVRSRPDPSTNSAPAAPVARPDELAASEATPAERTAAIRTDRPDPAGCTTYRETLACRLAAPAACTSCTREPRRCAATVFETFPVTLAATHKPPTWRETAINSHQRTDTAPAGTLSFCPTHAVRIACFCDTSAVRYVRQLRLHALVLPAPTVVRAATSAHRLAYTRGRLIVSCTAALGGLLPFSLHAFGVSAAAPGSWSSPRHPIPKVSFPANADSDSGSDSEGAPPGVPAISISVSGSSDDDAGGPVINILGADDDTPSVPSISIAGADEDSSVPQISVATNTRGRAYCNLDYHELFAPKCYHCKTSIIDERFITLDDPELGKRTYHEQHFFCAECGDPFMDPKGASFRSSGGGQTFSGDGEFSGGDGDVRFTVYGGHPYCENCHVRLRYPKCKKCKKPIRDGMRAVEALGGKYCWECFTCAGCDQPFENPSFFQRDGKPFCERCFSIIIKNEM